MGLSPLMAIYQARFNRYLEDRASKPRTNAKVWAFLATVRRTNPNRWVHYLRHVKILIT